MLIASYPRSGNNLVRFFIEYVTGRATLGCADTPEDGPIFAGAVFAELAHVCHKDPVARKAHQADEIRALQRRVPLGKMILVQRDPAEAILSYRPRPKGMSRLRYLWKVAGDARRYNALNRLFRSWPHPKLLVRYDYLTSGKGAVEITRIVRFLGEADSPRGRQAVKNFRDLREYFGEAHQPSHMRSFSNRGDVDYYKKRADPLAVKIIYALVRPAN